MLSVGLAEMHCPVPNLWLWEIDNVHGNFLKRMAYLIMVCPCLGRMVGIAWYHPGGSDHVLTCGRVKNGQDHVLTLK